VLEASIGTDTLNSDTDGDGLSDYEEINWDGDPSSYNGSPGYDLNPLAEDSDGDGFKDGMEVASGYDPLDAMSFPVWGDINDDRLVNAADVLLATSAVLGNLELSIDMLARGNVAPLVNGTPNSKFDDDFNLADLLLILRKAVGEVNY
jgi:hypothetical protein